MQTLYYTTDRAVQAAGKVIDLQQYRRALEAEEMRPRQEDRPDPGRPSNGVGRRWREIPGLSLDLCASAGILVMTAVFTLRVLCM